MGADDLYDAVLTRIQECAKAVTGDGTELEERVKELCEEDTQGHRDSQEKLVSKQKDRLISKIVISEPQEKDGTENYRRTPETVSMEIHFNLKPIPELGTIERGSGSHKRHKTADGGWRRGNDRHDSGAAAFWTFWLNYGILKLKGNRIRHNPKKLVEINRSLGL